MTWFFVAGGEREMMVQLAASSMCMFPSDAQDMELALYSLFTASELHLP